jgi:hypothetical protein
MQSRHWFFLVGALLYVVGIGFVIAGGRTAREAPATRAQEVPIVPVATVKQIMKGVVGPAATKIFDAVVTSITVNGIEEKAPHTDAEWEEVGNSAAALIESGNLLLVGNRLVDKGDWVKISREMIEAGKVALKAIEAKNADELLASGEAINASCDNCHRKYQRGS